jgi:hypothetical protein
VRKKEIENKFLNIRKKYNEFQHEKSINEALNNSKNYQYLNNNFDYNLHNHYNSSLTNNNNDYLNISLNKSYIYNDNGNKIKELPKISNVSKSQKNIFLNKFYFPNELIQTKNSINQVNKLMEEVINEL